MYGCCLLGADLIPQETIPFAQLFDLHLGLDHPLGLGEGEPLAGAVRSGAPRPHYLEVKIIAEICRIISSLEFALQNMQVVASNVGTGMQEKFQNTAVVSYLKFSQGFGTETAPLENETQAC